MTSGRPGKARPNGFTLVELMVAMLIFGMLSAAGVALLSFSVRAQAAADERLGALAGVRRAGGILTSDLAQAAPRISRGASGAQVPAFLGGSGQGDALVLGLVRRGWENLDDSNRSSLQRVEYRLSGGSLQRMAYRHVDGGVAMPPLTLMEGVRQLRLRYRDKDGGWRERWDPLGPLDMPLAVELIVETEDSGSIRQLFLVGTAV